MCPTGTLGLAGPGRRARCGLQVVHIDVVRALDHQQWMLRAQLSDRA
jgi:hypothetical protein